MQLRRQEVLARSSEGNKMRQMACHPTGNAREVGSVVDFLIKFDIGHLPGNTRHALCCLVVICSREPRSDPSPSKTS